MHNTTMTMRNWILTLNLCLLAGCISTDRIPVSSEIPVVDFNSAGKSAFTTDEIFEEFKIVRLETTEQSFVAPYSRYLVGEKYIIVFVRERILQFSIDGSFIRQIAMQGKGPNEFLYVGAYTLNRSEDKLYYDDSDDRTKIAVVDLLTGEFLPGIPKPLSELASEGFPIRHMMMFDDGVIYCVPTYIRPDVIYAQRVSGEWIASFSDSRLQMNAPGRFNIYVLNRVGSEMRFMGSESDTLYALTNSNTISPMAVLTYKDKLQYVPGKNEIGGMLMSLAAEGEEGILFQSWKSTWKQTEGSVSGAMYYDFREAYFTWKNDFRPIRVTGMQMDNLEIPLSTSWYRSGDRSFRVVEPTEFKSMLRQAISNSTGNAEVVARWQAMDAQINENDNPILIIGKLK